MYVGAAWIVGAMGFFIVTGGTTGMVGGGGVLVGAAVMFIGNHPPKRDEGVPLRRGDALMLPRRWLYGYLTGIGLTLIGIGLSAISVLGSGSSTGGRYAPEALVLAGVPVTVVGVLMTFGALLQRGSVRFSVTELVYVRVLGRTQRYAWSDIKSRPTYDRGGIVITGGGRRLVIPTAAQTWTARSVVTAIERFRGASGDERRHMIETTEIARPLV